MDELQGLVAAVMDARDQGYERVGRDAIGVQNAIEAAGALIRAMGDDNVAARHLSVAAFSVRGAMTHTGVQVGDLHDAIAQEIGRALTGLARAGAAMDAVITMSQTQVFKANEYLTTLKG